MTHTNEGWEKEFDKLMNEVRNSEPSEEEVCEFGYRTQREDGVFTVTDWGNIKSFISRTEKQAYERGVDAAVACVPLEQLHQLPDDVGSPHETEFDRGHNACREATLRALEELKSTKKEV